MNNAPKTIFNRKVLLSGIAILICAGVIVISSFFPFLFDPERWQTKEFLSDELIIVAIVVFSVVSALFIGQTSNASNPASEIAKSRSAFFNSIEKITDINKFHQWVKRILQPRDIKTIEKRVLRENGIKHSSVINLEIEEIKSLLNHPQKFGDKYYPGMTKEQINVILDVKKGKYNIKLVEPTYYLTVSNINSDITITEKSGKESIKKTAILTFSIVWKVIITVFVAMIFASLAKDTATGADTATSLMKFISRMNALVSGCSVGYRIGTQMNDIDADYINMRVSVHSQFLQDTNFVALSEEELIKEEYEQLIKDYEEAHNGTKCTETSTNECAENNTEY